MPRQLDASARDDSVIAAAWRVIARDGLAALTVRRLAAESGLAPSSLRYTFPTQAAVREKALAAVAGTIRERVAALPAGEDRAEAMLLELLPLDAGRRLEMEVYLALGVAAMTDDSLHPFWRAATGAVRAVCTDALREAGRERDVDELHALVDGLALHLLLPMPPRDPRGIVREYLR